MITLSVNSKSNEFNLRNYKIETLYPSYLEMRVNPHAH